ncbi:MAG: DNA polymerase IV [Pseudomonadota bacterium]
MTETKTNPLCRDCGARPSPGSSRCGACGRRRILTHPELDDLEIAHIDCDAFYAAVEKRDNPELENRPVIIGGGRRGVVSTACYIARINGVRSAMPMFKALKACPDAVVIRPDMAKYVDVSRKVREKMLALTPLVEPLSIDEAFLDLSGTSRIHGRTAAESLAALTRDIENDIGITVSVGLSHNKFLAKLASDQDKPRGFFVIGGVETETVLAALPVSRIWGVGAGLQKKLDGDGIKMIADLQRMELKPLLERYGSIGERLFYLSRGIDHRRVKPERDIKSVSHETTFDGDISSLSVLESHLWHLAENVSARMKAKSLVGRTVNLKLKTAGFKILTRSQTLSAPTQMADAIYRTAQTLLERETGRRSYRLIGVGLSELDAWDEAAPDAENDLFDTNAGRRASAERAVDAIRNRYGKASINLGRSIPAIERRKARGKND